MCPQQHAPPQVLLQQVMVAVVCGCFVCKREETAAVYRAWSVSEARRAGVPARVQTVCVCQQLVLLWSCVFDGRVGLPVSSRHVAVWLGCLFVAGRMCGLPRLFQGTAGPTKPAALRCHHTRVMPARLCCPRAPATPPYLCARQPLCCTERQHGSVVPERTTSTFFASSGEAFFLPMPPSFLAGG